MRHFAPPHSPNVIPDMAADIQALCNDSLDKIKAKGSNTFDVVDEYAYPVPVAVICQILGVPVEDEPTFHEWIFDFMAGTDMGPDAATEEGRARAGEGPREHGRAEAYMAGLIEGFVEKPKDNVLSKLVSDTDGPDGPWRPQRSRGECAAAADRRTRLDGQHHRALCAALLRNPESIELLREKPELIPKAIEEVLRLQSAVQFFPSRSVTADVEVGGTVIPAGSAVHLLYGAANRDPKRFPDPEKFDIQRPDNQHVGWGRGVHSCVGGPLARLEVNIALETFLRRVENPRLVVDPPPYRQNQIFRGPLHLEVEFDRITGLVPSRPSSSSNGNGRANFGTCRCQSRDRGRCWSRSVAPVPATLICTCSNCPLESGLSPCRSRWGTRTPAGSRRWGPAQRVSRRAIPSSCTGRGVAACA